MTLYCSWIYFSTSINNAVECALKVPKLSPPSSRAATLSDSGFYSFSKIPQSLIKSWPKISLVSARLQLQLGLFHYFKPISKPRHPHHTSHSTNAHMLTIVYQKPCKLATLQSHESVVHFMSDSCPFWESSNGEARFCYIFWRLWVETSRRQRSPQRLGLCKTVIDRILSESPCGCMGRTASANLEAGSA